MERRHAKIDLCGEVIQKGGRCQSSAGAQGRSTSAVSDKLRLSGSSFRSIKSGHFREIHLQESVAEQASMKGKVVPDDSYKVLNDAGDSKLSAAYDNEAAELEEGPVKCSKLSVSSAASYDNEALELEEGPVKCSKLSVSSAASYGLVMEGSRSQRAAMGESMEPDLSVGDVPVEAKKYALPDCEATAIQVKEAAAKTFTYNVIESAGQPQKNAHEEKESTESTEMKEMHPVQTKKQTESAENPKFITEEEATLKRSSTVETNSSFPSTSYTFDSSQRPSTSFYESQRDETLLIDHRDDLGSCTLSGTDDLTIPPEEFEVPPGISAASFRTYQLIQKDGFKPGRCLLITMVVITFCVTMIMAVLILIMPKSFKEKTDGSASLDATTPSPGQLHRIDDTIHSLSIANDSLTDLLANS